MYLDERAALRSADMQVEVMTAPDHDKYAISSSLKLTDFMLKMDKFDATLMLFSISTTFPTDNQISQLIIFLLYF